MRRLIGLLRKLRRKSTSSPVYTNRFLLEQLEPRILLSANLTNAAADALNLTSHQHDPDTVGMIRIFENQGMANA